jgi:hypothetical protein
VAPATLSTPVFFAIPSLVGLSVTFKPQGLVAAAFSGAHNSALRSSDIGHYTHLSDYRKKMFENLAPAPA